MKKKSKFDGHRPYIPKEVSWLSFNARVLQEAEDPAVPLLDRLKFLGIYSSNLDEFFEVRVATLKRLSILGKKQIRLFDEDPKKVLGEVKDIVIRQHEWIDRLHAKLLLELESHNVFLVNEQNLTTDQQQFVRNYFRNSVRSRIFPIKLVRDLSFPKLTYKAVYLAVRMSSSSNAKKFAYSVIRIPSDVLPRFVQLPSQGKNKYIIMLDDVIRFGLPEIFRAIEYDTFEAYDFKLNRDAELDIEDDLSESYLNKVAKSIKKRKSGDPVRIGYDAAFPEDMLKFFLKKLGIARNDTCVPGGRYHNFRDYMAFPRIINDITDPRPTPVHYPLLEKRPSILSVIREKDIMLHYPYHSFQYFIDLIRECSLDSKVMSIRITVYRVAANSSVLNALINARKNGKEVVVILELQARFDEEVNVYWANKLMEEGIKVIFGVPGLKVHAKLFMITRRENNGKLLNYCGIGTGNFNEETARIYTDHYLFTCDKRLTTEIEHLFDFFEHNYHVRHFRHIIPSPFSLRPALSRLITTEIRNARQGKDAWILLKINNLADQKIISDLYEASQAGVKIRIIGRSMFSLVPGLPGLSENIEAISIVDSFLEHSRLMIFCNNNNNQTFISSADWLPRNFDRRIEVTCPIYNETLQKQLKDIFEILWQDNVKARILDQEQSNQYRPRHEDEPAHRAQHDIFEYLRSVAE